MQGQLNRSPLLLRRAGRHGQARCWFDTRHEPSGFEWVNRLVLPAADADVAFAPLVVRAEGSCDPGPVDERLEVVLDKVVVRLDAATPAGRIAEIVSALNASA